MLGFLNWLKNLNESAQIRLQTIPELSAYLTKF
ncbi:MAG: hypothetical protein ACK4PM_14620 [Acinetobacter junii]